MKMAMKDGMLRIIEADDTQAAIIKSWGKMKYSRVNQMYEGQVSAELLNKLSELLEESGKLLPASIEELRQQMNAVQNAVDHERVKEDPKPLYKYPVTKPLYQHQVRAANMALLTFGMIEPEKENESNDHQN